MPDQTETEAITDLVRATADRMTPMPFGPERKRTLIVTRGADGREHLHLVDETGYDPGPPFPVGEIVVTDAASFVQAVKQRTLSEAWPEGFAPPVVYADEATMAIIAVLNDDTHGITGARDYRVKLNLQPTVEWARWTKNDDKLLGQEAFADHVERSIRDIEEPDSATMLEIAQRFEATVEARFVSGTEIRTGARSIQYVERVESGGGKDGNIELPEQMVLGIQPFYGAVTKNDQDEWVPARMRVEASVRFKIRDEHLHIGYRIVDPHEVERHAWRQIATQIAEGLETTFIAGPAPATVRWERRTVEQIN